MDIQDIYHLNLEYAQVSLLTFNGNIYISIYTLVVMKQTSDVRMGFVCVNYTI